MKVKDINRKTKQIYEATGKDGVSVGDKVTHPLMPRGAIVLYVNGNNLEVRDLLSGKKYTVNAYSVKKQMDSRSMNNIRESVMGDLYVLIDNVLKPYIEQGVKYDRLHLVSTQLAKQISKDYGISEEDAGHIIFQYITDEMENETGIQEQEGSPEGIPHLTKTVLKHIVQQIGTEGAHAITKSLEWGDGAAEELLQLIKHDLENHISLEESVKQRLDKSCWKGYHKSGNKMKNGKRVNNCVPNESVTEAGAGINRAAPANDVSHEKDLEPTKDRKPNKLEKDLNDIEVDSIYESIRTTYNKAKRH
jgi:hypothetical protein